MLRSYRFKRINGHESQTIASYEKFDSNVEITSSFLGWIIQAFVTSPIHTCLSQTDEEEISTSLVVKEVPLDQLLDHYFSMDTNISITDLAKKDDKHLSEFNTLAQCNFIENHCVTSRA